MSPIATCDFTLPGSKRPPGQVGDDASGSWVRADGACLLVVADGIGSGSTSGFGARLAVELTAQEFAGFELNDAAGLRDMLDRVADAWQVGVRGAGHSVRQSATTLGVAVIDRGLIGLAAIGDCFGLVHRGPTPSPSDPAAAPGLFAVLDQGRSDPTRFVTSTATLALDRRSRNARAVVVDDPQVNGVLVSTDGLEDAFLRYGLAGGCLHIAEVATTAPQALFELTRTNTAMEISAAFAKNTALMAKKGDDVGLAVAVW
ncbi:protein phosphatase 2C domain-containing protein [Nocardioides ultimimeridianus]